MPSSSSRIKEEKYLQSQKALSRSNDDGGAHPDEVQAEIHEMHTGF